MARSLRDYWGTSRDADQAILAIENEARANALDEVRAAIDADPYPSDARVARRILLAILSGTER